MCVLMAIGDGGGGGGGGGVGSIESSVATGGWYSTRDMCDSTWASEATEELVI